nr:antitoxin Xre/MbcA/ParS toxin-binding domain-containing protein [Dyella mobilis]
MAQITEERNRLLVDAFGVLEVHYDLLAQALVQATGGRGAAARWMCARQKAFGGQTAYDLISEGDIDRVWDSIRI